MAVSTARRNSNVKSHNVQLLWKAFHAAPSEKRHAALWTRYQPLVAFVAERFNSKQHNVHNIKDLIDAGNVGLLDALASYEFNSELKFEELAVPEIQAAMVRSLAVQKNHGRHLQRLELATIIESEQAELTQGMLTSELMAFILKRYMKRI